jgi:tetratricopeptide (TPR) repeat protein
MFRLIVCLRALGRTDETFSSINQFQAKWPDHEAASRLFLWKGEILFNQKRYAPAEACFKRLLLNEDTTTQETAQYFLAQCYAQQGKVDLALQTYAKLGAKPFEPAHIYRPYALFAVAVGHQQKNEFAEAAKLFERLATEKAVPDPVREESMYRWAEFEFSQGRHEKAAGVYRDLLAKYPDGVFSREAAKRQVWAYYAMDNYAKAIELANQWLDKFKGGFDYELQYVYGASLAGNENYAEALPVFRKIVETASTPEDYAQMARFQEIVCLLNLRQYDATITAADGYVAAYPKAADAATAYCFGGQAAMGKKDYDGAIPRLRKALDTAVGEWPYYEATNLMLAEALENMGRYGEAAVLQRKLSTDKGIDNPSYFLIKAGESHRKAGDKAASVADFEDVLKRFPKQDDAVKAAMFNLTQLYSEMEQYPKAEALVRDLLARADVGNRARLLSFLGFICYQQDKYEEACDQLRKALAAPDAGAVRADASFYLAVSLLELGKTEEALLVFKDVLALPAKERPPFPEDLLFRLDKLYYARGQYAESESIVRWLLLRDRGETVYRASLRLSDILVAQNKEEEARAMLEELLRRLNAGELRFADPANAPMKEEVRAVLGEVYYRLGKNDMAVEAMEACLASDKLDLSFKTRARWVLAEVFLKEGHATEALPYAARCFMLASDDVYSPRGMHATIRAFLKLGKEENALNTWEDLKTRYPAYAEQVRGDPRIAAVVAKEKKTSETGEKQEPPADAGQ